MQEIVDKLSSRQWSQIDIYELGCASDWLNLAKHIQAGAYTVQSGYRQVLVERIESLLVNALVCNSREFRQRLAS